jgi:2-keto-4-pentenoate hydratase
MQDEIFERGMQAQLAAWQRRLAAGERRVGWKLGYMDTAARTRLGLPHPMVGYLTSGRLIPSGGVFHPAHGASLLAESEVALQLGRDIPPGSLAEAAQAAIAAWAPAIEIVDVTQPLDDIERILAGNLFHAAVVLGEPVDARRFHDLREVSGGLVVNDLPSGTVDPASLPDNPGVLLALVADVLGRFGECLCAGDWIITGSVIKPGKVQAGDSVVVDLGALGRVGVALTRSAFS